MRTERVHRGKNQVVIEEKYHDEGAGRLTVGWCKVLPVGVFIDFALEGINDSSEVQLLLLFQSGYLTGTLE